MTLRSSISAILVLALASCAYRPVVDPKTSLHPEKYETDLAECRELAKQGANPGGSAAGGALIGAGVGAAFLRRPATARRPGRPRAAAR